MNLLLPHNYREAWAAYMVSPPATLHHLRAQLVLEADMTRAESWHEMVEHWQHLHGASLIAPDPANNWASHMTELTAADITGRGETLTEAVADWCKAAMRTLEGEAVG